MMFGPEGGAGEKGSERGRARCPAGTTVRAGNGSPARSALSGRPFWALEAASLSLGAARPIPALISQLSDCIGLFLEDGRRTGGVRKGGTCLGKGGVGTPSCEAAAPPASPHVFGSRCWRSASLPLQAWTPELLNPALRAGRGGCIQHATRALSDPCCRPLPLPSRTASWGPSTPACYSAMFCPTLEGAGTDGC